MAKAKVFEVEKDALVDLFTKMGYTNAKKWGLDTLEAKVSKIQSLMDDDVTIKDKEPARLLKEIVKAQKAGQPVKVIEAESEEAEEDEEPEEIAASRKAHRDKILGKGKGKKGKQEEEEEEDTDDDDDDEEEEEDDEEAGEEDDEEAEEDDEEDDGEDDDEEDVTDEDEEDEDSDDEEDDEEEEEEFADDDPDDDEDESEDEDDDEDEDDEPKRKGKTVKKTAPKKKGKGKAEEKDESPVKKTKKKGGGFPKGEGVIAYMIEMLKAASKKNPISKPAMLKKLMKKFPKKPESALKGTLNTQVPSHLRNKKRLNVKKNENGYWIAPGEPE